mgnify:CR=1 FL=1
MKSDRVYLDQILEAVSKIENFVDGSKKEQFLADNKTQSAVILQLTLIGEVTKKISAETKQLIDLPWKEIAGFRDKAIHDYFEIDLDVVWNTLTDDLPVLKEKLK